MKGIILAGGSGSRLNPMTNVVSKQLLPIYDKPMIYYPLSTLMLAGIREVLVISTPHDTPNMERLLGDGSAVGLTISYAVQQAPNGLAEAFLIGEAFIGDDTVCLILGDNLLYGTDLQTKLTQAASLREGAMLFGYPVHDPHRFGIVEFDDNRHVISIEEKPARPKSHIAAVGLYFYDHHVVQLAKELSPSSRGELEITDLNKRYLEQGALRLTLLGRGTTWLDTGTPESMLEAGMFVRIIQERQGLMISAIEEIAYRMGFITLDDLVKLGEKQQKSRYGQYLLETARESSWPSH